MPLDQSLLSFVAQALGRSYEPGLFHYQSRFQVSFRWEP